MSGDLRKRLQGLPHSEFRAFLQEKCPDTERQISPEAERTAQINTLLGREPRDEVARKLEEWQANGRWLSGPATSPEPASVAPPPKARLGPALGGLVALSMLGVGALSSRLLLPQPLPPPALTVSTPKFVLHVRVGSIEEADQV